MIARLGVGGGEKMMCYRDMTFCTFWKKCIHGKECGRALTPEVEEDAKQWWKGDDPQFCCFVDKPECF